MRICIRAIALIALIQASLYPVSSFAVDFVFKNAAGTELLSIADNGDVDVALGNVRQMSAAVLSADAGQAETILYNADNEMLFRMTETGEIHLKGKIVVEPGIPLAEPHDDSDQGRTVRALRFENADDQLVSYIDDMGDWHIAGELTIDGVLSTGISQGCTVCPNQSTVNVTFEVTHATEDLLDFDIYAPYNTNITTNTDGDLYTVTVTTPRGTEVQATAVEQVNPGPDGDFQGWSGTRTNGWNGNNPGYILNVIAESNQTHAAYVEPYPTEVSVGHTVKSGVYGSTASINVTDFTIDDNVYPVFARVKTNTNDQNYAWCDTCATGVSKFFQEIALLGEVKFDDDFPSVQSIGDNQYYGGSYVVFDVDVVDPYPWTDIHHAPVILGAQTQSSDSGTPHLFLADGLHVKDTAAYVRFRAVVPPGWSVDKWTDVDGAMDSGSNYVTYTQDFVGFAPPDPGTYEFDVSFNRNFNFDVFSIGNGYLEGYDDYIQTYRDQTDPHYGSDLTAEITAKFFQGVSNCVTWSGDLTGVTIAQTLEVPMDGDRSITAEFSRENANGVNGNKFCNILNYY